MEKREVNYAAMYHKMVNAVEDAMRILIEAQQQCEEWYIDPPEPAVGDQREGCLDGRPPELQDENVL